MRLSGGEVLERNASLPGRLLDGLTLVITIGFVALSPALALPTESFAPDARSMGMGGAFTAIADGPFAFWWNPAGLALPQPLSFSPISRSELEPAIDGSRYGYGFGASGNWGSLGLGFGLTTMGAGDARDRAGFSSGRTIWLAGGIDVIRSVAPSWRGLRWGVGATLKQVRELSGRSYGVICESIPSAWNLDLGSIVSYRLSRDSGGVEPEREPPSRPRVINKYRREFVPMHRTDQSAYAGLRLGLMLRNLLDRRSECVSGDLYRPLHPSLRLGAAAEGGLAVVHPLGPLLTGIFSMEEEIVHRRDDPLQALRHRDYTVTRVGAEIGLLGSLAARAGRVHDPDREIDGWSWGLGLGCDLWDPGKGLGQLGARVDFASLPAAVSDARAEQWTFTFWVLH
jgi:hypothetical protein